jgi:DNA-binding NtrC family response regulator
VRIGASDYLVKPVDVERLRAILRRQPQAAELKSEIGELREELRRVGRFGHMFGDSPPMQALYDKLSRVAPTGATVLLTGESGHGKELAARTIHDLQPAQEVSVPRHQLRRHLAEPDRERALRPREGQLHRRRPQHRASSSRPRAARSSSTR